MKKGIKIAGISIASLALACLLGLIITGAQIGWGPFASLYSWDKEVNPIAEKYDADERQGEIIFYGASNFRLWPEMEDDLSEYKVQNHAFGGSTDKLLVEYADKLLYPYNPSIVFFQTGSNDYVSLSGTDEEKVKACMEYKKQMFDTFHEKCPNAKFVVMSGLLLPGRSEYRELTQMVNDELEEYCNSKDYMYFVDSEDMTYQNGEYREDLFIKDGIHLNHTGQLLWRDEYIKPALDKVIKENNLSNVMR